MERKEINIKNVVIENPKLERVEGVFQTEKGDNIKWYGYRLKLTMDGVVFKFKLDKAFNDTMEEVIEDKKEEEE